MSWFIRWNSSFDLSRGGIELSFRKADDMNQLLVRTEATHVTDQTIEKITTPLLSDRCHIVGTRGFGKSTVLNYFAHRLYKELSRRKVLPVYSSISGTVDNEKDLEFVFFKSLLEGMFDVPSDMNRLGLEKEFNLVVVRLTDANIDYKRQLQKFGSVTSDYIKTALKNQLTHLGKDFQKIVFLIDGLDKQKTDLVLKFLRDAQEELSNLITKHNLMLVDSADPDWRQVLGTKEFGGIRGTLINLRGWTSDEVRALIENRLYSVGIFQMPFDQKALETLVEDFQGNPREILQYCTTLLHFAASQKIATIGPGLARKIVWHDASKEKFFNFIITNSEARYAFEKLKTLYDNRQTMNILFAAYNRKMHHLSVNLDFEERSSIGITLTDVDYRKNIDTLLRRGCLRVKTQNYVELEDDLIRLFDYIADLDESLVALPVVLAALEPRVVKAAQPPKEDISIKEEVQKLFEQHSNQWISYVRCAEMLLENPKTKDMLKERYKEDYEGKIVSIIPTITHELLREAKLMKDEEFSEFRWKPSLIDFETAEYFQSKTMLDAIEQAMKAASDGEVASLISLCERLLVISCTKLTSFTYPQMDLIEFSNAMEFLSNLNIEVTKPISFASFVRALKEPVSDINEARVYLQVALLYSRKIFSKISQMKNFEPRNQEIMKQLEKSMTGCSKVEERKYFNSFLLPLVLQTYGKTVETMTELKIGSGVVSKVPPEFDDLVKNGQILQAAIFRCPICQTRSALPESENVSPVSYCMEDKVMCEHVGQGYVLSQEAYQAWGVWMEEYVRSIIEKLPIKYVDSGVMLKPKNFDNIASPAEIDIVAIINGKLIAIECTEKITLNAEKNDIANIVSKMAGLGFFDRIILVYRQVNDESALNAEVSKHEKSLFPVVIAGPNNLKSAFLQVFQKLG